MERLPRDASDEDILVEVNDLIKRYWTRRANLTSILQCTSSFFVLLYQRMFATSSGLPDTFTSPETLEQKLHNMKLVLMGLQEAGYGDVISISAERVVQQDEHHVRQLIRLFVEINHQRQMQQRSPTRTGMLGLASSSAALAPPSRTNHTAAAPEQPVVNVKPTVYYTSHAPYIVAEVAPSNATTSNSAAAAAVPTASLKRKGDTGKSVGPGGSFVDLWRSEVAPNPEPVPDMTMDDEEQRQKTEESATAEERVAGLGGEVLGDEKATPPEGGKTLRLPPRKVGSTPTHGAGSKGGMTTTTPTANPPTALKRSRPASGSDGARPPTRPTRATLRKSAAAVREPPLTPSEQLLFARQPHRFLDRAARDVRIEQLRCARFQADIQQLLRRRMQHDYDTEMRELRESLKVAEAVARQNKLESKQMIREYSDKRRAAYAALVEAAASETHIPHYMMSPETEELYRQYRKSIGEGHRAARLFQAERERAERAELRRYSRVSTAWQLT